MNQGSSQQTSNYDWDNVYSISYLVFGIAYPKKKKHGFLTRHFDGNCGFVSYCVMRIAT